MKTPLPACPARTRVTTASAALGVTECATAYVLARSPSDRDRDADGAVDDVVVGEHLARRGDDHPGAGRGAIAVRRLDDRVDVDYCGVDFGRDGRRVDGAVAVQRRDSRDWRARGRRLAGLRQSRGLRDR